MTILPRQFDHFAERLQIELNFRPVVFIAWNGAASSGRTFKGGTLEGLMAVSIEGEQWVEETEDARRGWFHHLAHESFHFWDGEMFEPKPEDAELDRAISNYATRCQSFSRTDFRSFYTHEYASLESMRGCMNILRSPNPNVYSRANYMRVLQTWINE